MRNKVSTLVTIAGMPDAQLAWIPKEGKFANIIGCVGPESPQYPRIDSIGLVIVTQE